MTSHASHSSEQSPSRLLSLGSTGITFKLSKSIAVKKVRPGQEAHFANERNVFKILALHPSPYIIQSFYQTQKSIFLEYLPGGDLAALVRQGQRRDPSTQRVLGVTKRLPPEHCLCWMRQLVSAASWLEQLGLAHCDIRPANMLLCDRGWAKLADFDRTLRVGDLLLSGTEPFSRLLGEEGGLICGTYGSAGYQTEQFAVGSVFYTLTRGYEPFEDEWWGADHGLVRMENLQRMEFPALNNSKSDDVINRCWHGQYESVASISADLGEADDDAPLQPERSESPDWHKAREVECKMIIESGVIDQLVPF